MRLAFRILRITAPANSWPSLYRLKQVEVLALLCGAVADRFEEEIADRIAFRFVPRVEERRGDHEILSVQKKQSGNEIFLVFATRRENIANIFTHRPSVLIRK